jgi:capsid protein
LGAVTVDERHVLVRKPVATFRGHAMMAASWIDRALASVAPGAARKRLLERHAFEKLSRAYDGAAVGRRTEGWRSSSSSADGEIASGASRMRDRMRDLTRNNPHAAKAVAVLVNNIVGAGIRPRAATGTDALDNRINELWEAWTARSDADGLADVITHPYLDA